MITTAQKLALLQAEASIIQTKYVDWVTAHPDFTLGTLFTDPDGFFWRIDFLTTANNVVTPIATWIEEGVDTQVQRLVYNLDELTLYGGL